MKRVILSAVLAIAFCTASFASKVVAKGPTFTALGDYKIETATNPAMINGEECKTFTISYAYSPMSVKVAVWKAGKCTKYVVMSDKLSVQYVCNGAWFGVEKLDKALQKDGISTSDSELNLNEYYHQKLISQTRLSEIESTQMIAAYFPLLLNNQTEVVAAK
ncbi:MAG: hypothetical protein JXR67_11115 [Bacteroidales bacterium]|nr:hypothetical protein [Bacteroidales bacterium]